MAEKSRPILITILALIYFIVGVLGLISGILIVTGSVALTDVAEDFEQLGVATAGGVVILLSLVSLIIAGGFWNGWRIMWYLGVIFTAISLVAGIVSIFVGGFVGIIPLIIDAIIMWYLFRPGVKEFFGI